MTDPPVGASSPHPSTPLPASLRAAIEYPADDSITGRQLRAAQDELRADPTALDPHIALASLLLRRQRETSNAALGHHADAVLRSARAMAPEDARVLMLTAMVRHDGHEFTSAAELARQVLAIEPSNATAHLVLGDTQLELGDYEGAMDSVQRAVDLHPDLRSYSRAAHLRWLMGDFDSALAIMELAIDAGSPRDPEASAWCFADIGAMFLHRGDSARALAAAQRALTLVPDYVPARVIEARARARQGRTKEAIGLLSAAVERKPSVEDLLRLAQWHRDLGETESAASWQRRAEALADDDPGPLARDLARRGEHSERALALARQAHRTRDNIASNDVLALASARAGDHETAQAAMARALSLGTADAHLHLHAALVHALAGRIESARSSMTTANRIDPDADPPLVREIEQRLGAA
ncbi:MAG: tetratricopeptide repeat protein [Myxococcota bacterium]